MPRCFRPRALSEALEILADTSARPVAGGTDVYPALGDRPADFDALDLSAIEGLRGIARTGAGWRIGAATTWTDLARAPLPPAFDALKQAARQVGAVQIQNTGTLGGNLCNASPAADGAPPLLALNASVELASTRGARTLPLEAFLLGPRRTARAADELMTAILVPEPPPGATSAFVKLGARAHLVISVAMAAALVAPERGRVGLARVAVGACSPVARRLPALEAALGGLPFAGGPLAATVAAEHLDGLAPIDDVRAGAAYRARAAAEIVRRALAQVAREAAA